MGKHSFAHRQVLEDVYAGAIFLEADLMRRKLLRYFSRAERLLWGLSVVFIVGSFCAFDRENYLTLAASLIGVTSLIFNAKGNPIGQVLMVLFSLLYGIISYTFAYYGEMVTYLGMTMPMAVFASKNRQTLGVCRFFESYILQSCPSGRDGAGVSQRLIAVAADLPRAVRLPPEGQGMIHGGPCGGDDALPQVIHP